MYRKLETSVHQNTSLKQAGLQQLFTWQINYKLLAELEIACFEKLKHQFRPVVFMGVRKLCPPQIFCVINLSRWYIERERVKYLDQEKL